MTDRRLRMPTANAQVLVKYDLDGQPCENVFYVQKMHKETDLSTYVEADFDGGAADIIGARVKTWLQTNWAPLGHVLASATEVDVIWNTVVGVGPLRGQVYQDTDYPITGTNIGEPLPNNCTVAVELRTPELGRSFHGRQYVVGLSDGSIDATAPNQLKASALADVPAVWEALRTSMTAETEAIVFPRDKFPMVVMSFRHAGSDRSPALATEITSVSLSDPYLDSMRRRLPAHNRHGRRA